MRRRRGSRLMAHFLSPCRNGRRRLFQAEARAPVHPPIEDIPADLGNICGTVAAKALGRSLMNLRSNPDRWEPKLPEDPRLVRGEGRFTDDVGVAGQAYAVMVRSRNAHGLIRAIDTAAARAM